MKELKKIERKWIDQFRSSALVKDGVFQKKIAYQLFYGFNNDSIYKLDFPIGFQKFNDNYNHAKPLNEISNLLKYLSFIGITLSQAKLEDAISTGKQDSKTVLKKAFYLLKHLSSYNRDLNLSDPYYDNLGDLYFFLRIEGSDTEVNQQLTLFEELDLPDFFNKYIELPENYENDKIAVELFQEIENTNNSYFITGKAGTGKSTFIHYFTKKTSKETLLFAFTGIAAINIGGQTLHSFFNFPLKPILPRDKDIKKFNPNFQKFKILQKVKTIIIDEVSMLRSDILEALDYSLRINGGEPDKLFGGKQMIFVGDAFQLPPVVDRNKPILRHIFSKIYESEYFFDSPSFRKLKPNFFEFNKVHRQTEGDFIKWLNRLRVYDVNDSVLEYFNKRFFPNYTPDNNEFVMMLTSNNYIANEENKRRLLRLPYVSKTFTAKIDGDFKEDAYPTLSLLELKRGAQVMFIKNDSYENDRRWVNGTIGKINFIKENSVEVELANGKIYEVFFETWENRKYQWDRAKGKITSKVIGTFMQLPIKLAWAITIHKSQGLSFDKVNIDLGKGAFINGQLYTALSRCRKIEGLTLKKRIKKSDIIVHPKLIEFTNAIENQELISSRKFLQSEKEINQIMNTLKEQLNVVDYNEFEVQSNFKLVKLRLNTVLDFGIHTGKTLEQCLKIDSNYMLQLLNMPHIVIAPTTLQIIEDRILDFEIPHTRYDEMKLKNEQYINNSNS